MKIQSKLLRKKRFWLFTVALIITVCVVALVIREIWLLTHTRQDESTQTQINIYNSFGNYSFKNTALSDIIDKYMEENKDTMIINSSMSNDRFYTKLHADFSADCAADIIITAPSYDIKQLYKRGYIANLDAEFQNNSAWDSIFDKNIMRFTTDYDAEPSHVYGLPFEVRYIVLYYNTEIFNKYHLQAPQSYPDFKNAVYELSKTDNIAPIAAGAIDNDIYLYQILCSMLEKTGNSESAGELPEQYLSAANYMKELYEMGAFPNNYMTLTQADAQKMFLDGSAAMIVETNSFINEIAQYANSSNVDYTKYTDKFNIVAFPCDNQSGIPYKNAFSTVAYNAGDFTVFINKKSYENKHDKIMDIVQHLTNPDILRLYTAQINDIMVVGNIKNNEYNSRLITKCNLAIEDATKFTYMPVDLTYRNIWFTQISNTLPNVLNGTVSSSQLSSDVTNLMQAVNKREGDVGN